MKWFRCNGGCSRSGRRPVPSNTQRLSKATGATGYLKQGDILQQIGSILTARSDSFKIRCYGDSIDSKGKIRARAWCEASVQRSQTPISPDPDKGDLDPIKTTNDNQGREFIITSFRWINPKEITL